MCVCVHTHVCFLLSPTETQSFGLQIPHGFSTGFFLPSVPLPSADPSVLGVMGRPELREGAQNVALLWELGGVMGLAGFRHCDFNFSSTDIIKGL